MGKVKDLSGKRFGRLRVPTDAKPVMRDGHGSTVSCGCERADSDMRRLARSGPGPQDYLDDEMDAHESFREVDEPPESELEAAALGIWAPEAHREIRSRRAEEELEEAEERRRARE
jgi:hypothetical protein